jgi:tetratricopeptide (TPR) repeat protein
MELTTAQKRTVDSFLSTGRIGNSSIDDLINFCNLRIRNETQHSTASSIQLAKKFLKQSKHQSSDMSLTAFRAAGWVYLVAANYKESEKYYLKARKLALKDAEVRARIDRVLIDIYMYLGNTTESKKRANHAIRTFKRLNADEEVAKTKVNYANVLHRQDLHSKARTLYSQASEIFEKNQNKIASALCWYNLANTEVQLFDFSAAEKHFSNARTIFLKNNRTLHATGCLYGLAWIDMLTSDFHNALLKLNDCESYYKNSGQKRELLLCQLDRAETCLGLNLFVEARDAAKSAINSSKRLGIMYEQAKGSLFAGKAYIELGRKTTARAYLLKASKYFENCQNYNFKAVAKLFLTQLSNNNKGKIESTQEIRKLFKRAQLPLWEAVCDLQILSLYPRDPKAINRLSSNSAINTVPHLTAQYHSLMGDRFAGRNDIDKAIDHWSQAVAILDTIRAKLPPLDFRSSFFKSQSNPYKKLIETESQLDILRAAVWAERYRTAGLWTTSENFYSSNPIRQKVQESLSKLANQVSVISNILSGDNDKRTLSLQSSKKMQKLQQDVRYKLSTLEKNNKTPSKSDEIINLINKLSPDQPLVQFHVGHIDIYGFVHFNGETNFWRYKGGTKILNELIARWKFLIENSKGKPAEAGKTVINDERDLLKRISDWILPPLEISANIKKIVVIPDGQVANVPWQALIMKNEHLIDKYSISFCPSLRHFEHAKNRKTGSKKVKIFIGYTWGLSSVESEIKSLYTNYDKEKINIYNPAKRNDFPDKTNSRLWHFAGHAQYRADNPFYSALMLDDGPLFAADIRLMQNTVDLVTLSACRTGQLSFVPEQESNGLVRSLLEMGARNVLASNWAVSDSSTSIWMKYFYEEYFTGATVSSAVRTAALKVRDDLPSVYHWGSFNVHGAG